LVHIGTNDALQNIEPEETLNAVRHMISRLRAAHPSVQIHLAHYDNLATELSSEESPIFPVDVASATDPAIHTVDGIHPTRQGDALLAEAWAGSIFGAARLSG
jgi:lysophospholipase L1-like esterase